MTRKRRRRVSFNKASFPSELKITDIKICQLKDVPMDCSILKLETNQGVCGFGEVRDFASIDYAFALSRHLIGKNPCSVKRIMDSIRQFGGHGRKGGGVSGIEVALMDLAGKAYGVPCYQLLGGRYRDKVRLYADTDVSGKNDAEAMAAALKKRIGKGFSMLKMDLGVDLLLDVDGALSAPNGYLEGMKGQNEEDLSFGFSEGSDVPLMEIPHPFTMMRITEKGLDFLEERVSAIRDAIGYEVPLAIDHIGHVGFENVISLARHLEKYSLSWIEDPVPWFYTDQLALISQATTIPVCTGEDIYLRDNFMPLLEKRAVSVIHPDVLTVGGMNELMHTLDEAERHGVAACLHMAETPVGCMASAHVATAAGKNFVALEFHSFDVPWWEEIVKGGKGKIIKDGHIAVPDRPGLGIDELDDEVLLQHRKDEDGPLWISGRDYPSHWSHDRIWS